MSGKELVGDVLKVEVWGLVVLVVKVEGCVDGGFGSEGRRNVVQVEGGIVEVVEELVKVVDVGGGVGSDERRNVLLSDCGVADVEEGCVKVVDVGGGVGSEERRN